MWLDVNSIISPSICLDLYFTEVQEPYAVVVLLEKDLIVVDLTQSKYVTVKYKHIFQQRFNTAYKKHQNITAHLLYF